MKQFKTIMTMLMIFAAMSCSKNRTDGVGRVVFEVAGDETVVDQTRSNVSDYTTLPAKDAFTIKVVDSESSVVYEGLLTEWDSSTELPVGNYTVTASYGSLETEGFDKPYFTGVRSFAVTGGQPVEVSIPVSLGNTIIKMSYSDYFNRYYKNFTFKLTRDGSDIATFAKGDTKAAFVDGYKISIEGTLEGEMQSYTFEPKTYNNLDAATAYTFHFDISNVGGASVTVTFKEGYTETVELGNYELNND